MTAVSQASFTPAATSHVAGDVIGGAQEFKNIGNPGEFTFIISASLRINDVNLQTTAWRIHLFDVTPPSALADDAAFLLPAGDRASYLGYCDIAQVIDLGDTQMIENNNIWKMIRLRGSSLFGYLVNGTTLTTVANPHIITLGAVLA